jgi:nanoRNase/pAp phosphatase (c-di-AMP/oligoRNAs hydrolase)
MKNLDALSLEKIREIIDKNDSIGIIVRGNPGVDDMAAALSLYLSFLNAGKEVLVACPTQPLVEVSSLVGIDKVKSTFNTSKSGDLTVSFPYKEGEIEKISYTLEDGFLNILVKAGEQGLSFDENDIQYKRKGGAKKVIFTIGVTRLSEVNKLLDIDSLKDAKIVNIDNKKENQEYGDIVLVSNALSVSEQASFIILSLGLKLDLDIAQNLLSGIANATDNFQNPNTSALAFEMASVLMKEGATRKKTPSSSFSQPMQKATPPSDWLAPKIYKGSTAV